MQYVMQLKNGKTQNGLCLEQRGISLYNKNMAQVLYVHAMLAGHYTLGEQEKEILNRGLIQIIEYGLGGNV